MAGARDLDKILNDPAVRQLEAENDERIARDTRSNLRVVMRSEFLKGFATTAATGLSEWSEIERRLDAGETIESEVVNDICEPRGVGRNQFDRFVRDYFMGAYEPFEPVTAESIRSATERGGETNPYASIAKKAYQLSPEALAELRALDLID